MQTTFQVLHPAEATTLESVNSNNYLSFMNDINTACNREHREWIDSWTLQKQEENSKVKDPQIPVLDPQIPVLDSQIGNFSP